MIRSILPHIKLLIIPVFLSVPIYLLQAEVKTIPVNTVDTEPQVEEIVNTVIELQDDFPEEVNEKTKELEEIDSSIKCNCYAYIKGKYYPDMPNTTTILRNLSDEPRGVAVFYYPSSGLHHYAKVVEVVGERVVLDEANYSKCKIGKREISLNDPRLLGFYSNV